MTDKKKTPFHNPAPGELPKGAPRDAVRREFAKRLSACMDERGWNQSELARQTSKHIDRGRFGRDNVSGYVRGRVLPGPVHLHAMAKALKVPVDELLPDRMAPNADDAAPPLDMRDMGDGQAWLRVNQAVPWNTALEVAKLIQST